ncbi:MFS transporter [Kitasatospora sp. MMS16-BH015]|uniref:MFS transporter n=1 Tax=Kitasatospora sp. MMS16-BH015 TaxID=2018025 RepID=UPI000CA1D930|nr:MFS transporter [Kitasatospora sp. MMS16-BH015]AUG79343.1 MFS transporter [Kitasatospora sp. MMS16-BH015]
MTTDTLPAAAAPAGPTLRRVATTAFLGTAIEYYDFFIYGTAAALVFGRVFFPGLGASGALLAAFSVYAVAFLARPLGAVLFGHFGDRLGRKTTLVVSLLLMGLSTVAVGLLPGYTAWGWWAPLVLLLLRACQGIGLGGEWGGAALLLAEHAPPGQRGRYGAYLQLGPCVGFVLATGVFLALSEGLDEAAFLSWGWRVPFLASAALVLVGLFVRLRIKESRVFTEQAAEAAAGPVPVVELLRRHGRVVLLGGCATMIGYALFYLTTTFSLAYATTQLGISRGLVLGLLLVGAVGKGLAAWWTAGRSDRWGRRRMLQGAAALAAGWSLVFFPMLESGRTAYVALALCGGMVVLGCLFGPVAAFLPELFPTAVRYSGAALTYNIGGVLGGATAPIVASRLTAVYGTAEPVGWYLAGMGVVSVLCLAFRGAGNCAKSEAAVL